MQNSAKGLLALIMFLAVGCATNSSVQGPAQPQGNQQSNNEGSMDVKRVVASNEKVTHPVYICSFVVRERPSVLIFDVTPEGGFCKLMNDGNLKPYGRYNCFTKYTRTADLDGGMIAVNFTDYRANGAQESFLINVPGEARTSAETLAGWVRVSDRPIRDMVRPLASVRPNASGPVRMECRRQIAEFDK